MNDSVRVLVVDDSALLRRALRSLLESDPMIRVVGEAGNGREAIAQVQALKPDVVTMDVRMPVMDGLETTAHLMAYHPTPILVVTASLASYDRDITFQMLGAGALDIIEKPQLDSPLMRDRSRHELIRRVKNLSRTRVITHLRGRRRTTQPLEPPEPVAVPAVALPPVEAVTGRGTGGAEVFCVIVIGASAGGPRVVRQVLRSLPAPFPAAVLVAQHIAEGFSGGMAEWLNANCALPVQLARADSLVTVGEVLVAPDSCDMLVRSAGRVVLNYAPLTEQRSRPSVDIAMQSVAAVYGPRAVGVLLTGMGRDGALGMKQIRDQGGYTLAQSEETCAIYGMPRAAVELDAVDRSLAPDELVLALQRHMAQVARKRGAPRQATDI